ncbi:hypothetical protein GGR51DRAFT_566914 [Nemania sp. FL0031]|nr:hypothetical protein GGR51DRAFT_566914 [Nemania sp. FL0031]
MAIIKDVPGLEVTVEIDRRSLPEYDDPHAKICDDDDLEVLATATKEKDSVSTVVCQIPHVVKYIESIPGSEFSIRFVKESFFNSRCHQIGVAYEMDGIKSSLAQEPSRFGPGRWGFVYVGTRYYSEGVGWRGRKFKFNALQRVPTNQCSKQNICEDIARSKSLGTLRILVYRMESCLVLPMPPTSKAYIPRENLAEKALKGRALYAITGFGEEMPASGPTVCRGEKYQDPEQQPCAIFEFRYRTKEGLIEELIVPRPTPIDTMSDQEVREYARKAYLERQEYLKSRCDPKIKEEEALPSSSSKRRSTYEDILLPERYKKAKKMTKH